MKENKELLEYLIKSIGPSGNEVNSVAIWNDFMSRAGFQQTYKDKIGNSVFSLGQGKTSILLSAHIDSVAARVSHITKEGLICIVYDAGMDRETLHGSEVIILGDKGPILGIVNALPIHIRDKRPDGKNFRDYTDLRITIGASSDSEVLEKGIYPGCDVIYSKHCILDFGSNQVCGTGLDDKAGVYTISMIAKTLYELVTNNGIELSNYTIHFAAVTQEEVGAVGSIIAARNLNPDIAINLDVTFALDSDCGEPLLELGDIHLGKGAVIIYGSDKSRRLNSILRELCIESSIPYQTSASRYGGTDAISYQTVSQNCECIDIGLPCINMHTPVEICDWRDFDSAIDMIIKLIASRRL